VGARNANLKQLRAFAVVADKGSFVSAAEVLNMSQPALSQCIQQLEQQIGGRLFSRTTRKVYLTPLGMSFLPHARGLLHQFDVVMNEVEEMVARKSGRVRIACLPSIASRLMPRVLATNKSAFPGIHVTIIDANMRDVTAMVLRGEVDFGIGSSIAELPELNSTIFARDFMHAVLPFTSSLARRRVLHWSEIADQPFIAMSHDTGLRELVSQATRQSNLTMKFVAEVSNIATLNGMIEEGLGISALPGLALSRGHQSFLRYRPLIDPVVQRTIRLYHRSDIGLSPAASTMLSSLKQCIRDRNALADISNVEWDLAALDNVDAVHRKRITASMTAV
jgi:DNA-binding transcriptional LysR family regulator